MALAQSWSLKMLANALNAIKGVGSKAAGYGNAANHAVRGATEPFEKAVGKIPGKDALGMLGAGGIAGASVANTLQGDPATQQVEAILMSMPASPEADMLKEAWRTGDPQIRQQITQAIMEMAANSPAGIQDALGA